MAPPAELLVATTNPGKAAELGAFLAALGVRIVRPADLGVALPEVEETAETLLGNAQLKARSGARASGLACLADDSGLEVDALEGAPGVHSARYSGGGPEANNAKLLAELERLGDAPRTAVFRSVLVLADPGGREDWVSGACPGVITKSPRGRNGFGYDPIFHVPRLGKTFAEMEPAEKESVSHRGEALRRLRDLLLRW